MIVSEARLAANRRNALKSTGPTSEEGKRKSRANALKHGLCAAVVQPEDIELVQERSSDWFYALKPQDKFQVWLVNEIAIASIRVDRAERIERRVRDKVSLRAAVSWDDDRRLEAEVLGGMLGRKPAETVETLRRTPHGCDWLMGRWAMLAHAADVNGAWTEAQARLAFDLLATPAAFREGVAPGASIDLDGKVVADASDPAAVARREIDELKARREVAADLDEVERALVEADLTHDSDAELRKLRRYEAGLHRRIQWCMKQLRDPSPRRDPNPDLAPRWTYRPGDEPEPEPKTPEEVAAEAHPPGSVHPPFDLEPHEYPEPGEDADIPAILRSRRETRIAKAESRRVARRRKLERLRA